MYVPNGGFKADNSKDTPSTWVLAVWRGQARRYSVITGERPYPASLRQLNNDPKNIKE